MEKDQRDRATSVCRRYNMVRMTNMSDEPAKVRFDNNTVQKRTGPENTACPGERMNAFSSKFFPALQAQVMDTEYSRHLSYNKDNQ